VVRHGLMADASGATRSRAGDVARKKRKERKKEKIDLQGVLRI
jgi:hypothetical protein